ncbi:MAG: exodeoxyribonuclease VII large subunit [Anaerolineaceae bacterium]|nr:exodeoxyribonuclease VII large subunit [Anaerolineaceae bacterium]
MTEQPAETRRTINQVNNLVRALVEQETLGYPFWISGIVTRYYISNFGHVYFDLTDEDYTINCMLHERRRGLLDFEIAKGMEVEVFGSVRVYDKQAKVQIDVEQARLVNHDAYVMDISVQEQLAQLGCWPPQKRPLPQTIQRIGLVTSKHAEAMRDFEATYRDESGPGAAAIQVYDVRLQGDIAPGHIAETIERLNRENSVDVIALVRGGGREDELAVFNDIAIARAICLSTIPIITGIGHQRDDTLADQMADIKTITPTAAALELAKRAPQVAAPVQPTTTSSNRQLIVIAVIVIIAIVIVAVLLSGGPQ